MVNRRPNLLYLLSLITALIVILMLSSCSCEYHYGKLKKKCGIVKDTILVHDTIITNLVSRDTVFKYYSRDTVVVREGKLTMKYFYNSHDSTVYLNGRCAPDTIIREIRVPFDKFEVKPDYYPNWLKWSVITLLSLIIVGFILKKIT